MRYRTRTGKNVSDQLVLNNLTTSTARAISTSSSIGSFFIGLFNFLISVYAYISRSFLRIRIGERTFGIVTLLGVFFFVWAIFYFRDVYIQFDDHFRDDPVFKDLGFLAKIMTIYVSIMISFFGSFIPILQTLFTEVDIEYPSYSLDLAILSFIIFWLTVGHFVDVYSRKKRKEVIHSFYRGDSFFFEWLVNKKILGIRITKLGVWMVLEPIAVILLALFLENYFGLEKVPFLLKISAVCLFIEEYRVYQDNRQHMLDMLDGQLDGAFSAELQKEYSDEVENVTEPTKSITFRAIID